MATEHAIHVIGIGADGPAGLRPEQLERIRTADFLAGGERHLAFFPDACGERFVIKDNLPDLISVLVAAGTRMSQSVVLASGDPLFFGVGTYLAERLPSEILRIEPAISSMQLAFAR